jgi:hypothetical protein
VSYRHNLGIPTPDKIETESKLYQNSGRYCYVCDGPPGCPYWEWRHDTLLNQYHAINNNDITTWSQVSFKGLPEFVKLRFKLGV